MPDNGPFLPSRVANGGFWCRVNPFSEEKSKANRAVRLVYQAGTAIVFIVFASATTGVVRAGFAAHGSKHESLCVESLNKMSHGSAYSALPIQRLNAHRIFLPSPAEQEHIVVTLDALSEETQRLESIYQQKLTALDALKKSLLHQAFSGAL